MLEILTRDEERHAVLAWRFVAWALKTNPRLSPMVTSIVEAAKRAAHLLQRDEPRSAAAIA